MSTHSSSRTDDSMSDDILDMDIDMDDMDDSISSVGKGLDARRRLEDKLEEMRLNRELREFDFDFDA